MYMYNIRIHRIVIELCLSEKKKEKMNNIDIFAFGFIDLVKG